MSANYLFPIITQNGKHLALRQHVARHAGHTVGSINILIEDGQIEMHLIGLQIYIDVDEALTALAKSRFGMRRALKTGDRTYSNENADLFV
jgi:hypothetical protein